MKKIHRYTKEQVDYLKSICTGRTRQEIHTLFNQKFGLSVTFGSIRSAMSRYGIKNKLQGYNSQFRNGHQPWNKGKKGLFFGDRDNWFKKGDEHYNALPVGSESVKEGYVWVKVAQPSEWERKHLKIWRDEHGEIPDGKLIRFKDGNKMNVVLSNLFMTDRRVATSVVKRGLDYDEPSLKVAIHHVAELELAAKDAESITNKKRPSGRMDA